LCLMIMPGRSWVAGIDIAGLHLLLSSQEFSAAGQVRGPQQAGFVCWVQVARGFRRYWGKRLFYTGFGGCGNWRCACAGQVAGLTDLLQLRRKNFPAKDANTSRKQRQEILDATPLTSGRSHQVSRAGYRSS
jgi:hypothetical protein